jgi:solute carrier family 35, member E1
MILANGLCNFVQSFAAFSLLSLVSPLTYSVANTFKRVFVILTSIVWFGNPVSPLNYFGIFIAFMGILLYNRSFEEFKRKDKQAKLPQ